MGGARVDLGGSSEMYHHDGCVVRAGLDWIECVMGIQCCYK
jgi:hypothetical protein